MKREPIAVVGLASLFPGSQDLLRYWDNIVNRRDLIGDVPRSYWLIDEFYDADPKSPDKVYCKRGGFLPEVNFDPTEFGTPPNILPQTDSLQLLGLLVTKSLLEDAFGDTMKGVDREKVNVILGFSGGTSLLNEMGTALHKSIWLRSLRESGLSEDAVQAAVKRYAAYAPEWTENSFPGLLQNVIAGRIANRFDFHGTNCVTDAACASSVSAIHMAMSELQLGDADLAITGGSETISSPIFHLCFSKTPAFSPTGRCRPFDASGDGTLIGEGLGFLALKRLSDAERDDNKIYAVIRGIGTSSDGKSKSIYAPEPEGQKRAIRRAYAQAGFGPETVTLVEGHGTGTKAGDAAELTALSEVFSATDRFATSKDRQWCAVGSVKSQIGHTLGAAGAASLIKAVLALHHKVLPPTIGVDEPNPLMDFKNSPLYVNSETRPWIHAAGHPRRASVSSFGFGGTNFHVALEEYAGPGQTHGRLDLDPSHLFCLSGPSAEAFVAHAERVRAASAQTPFATLARETRDLFRAGDRFRAAIVATSPEDLGSKLNSLIEAVTSRPETNLSLPTGIYFLPKFQKRKLAFLFPGQGSQYVNMGAGLAMRFDACRAAWDLADGVRFEGAPRLSEIVFPRPAFTDEERKAQESSVTATEWAQPGLGTTSAALLALLKQLGLEADAVAGHSFGEEAALYAADAYGLEDFLKIARRRGELMARASTVPGAMAAVAGDVRQIEALLHQWDSRVVVANHNSPKQCVLSGELTEVAQVQSRLEEAGFKTTRLKTSTAFHSPLVSDSSPAFEEFLGGIPLRAPRIPVYSNTTAMVFPTEPSQMRRLMARHLAEPVRFAAEVQKMRDDGVNLFIEVGPGSVLTKLVGECLENPIASGDVLAVNLDQKGRDGVTSLMHALARLSAAGVPLNLAALDTRASHEEFRAPGKAAVKLTGATYKKKYPPLESETRDMNLETKKESPMELQRLLLEVVADKTGYPQDILTMDMNLEADLGIDSIKRVEILSAMRSKIPNAPEVPVEKLAQLQTLGEIVRFLGEAAPSSPPAPSPKLGEGREPTRTQAAGEGPGEVCRYDLAAVPYAGTSPISLAPGDVAILSDGEGVAEALAAKLRDRGLKTVVGRSETDLRASASLSAVIHLGGLRRLQNTNDGMKLNKEAFRAAKAVEARLLQAASKGGALWVTVEDLGGDFGLGGCDPLQAYRGGLSGLTKTLAHEWPNVRRKAIDVETAGRGAEAVAQALAQEILNGGDAIEVGLKANGERLTLALTRAPSPPTPSPKLGEGSVVVVSGGARGITASCAIALARATRAKIVLLGRSPVVEESEETRNLSDGAALKQHFFDQAQSEGRKPPPAEIEAQARIVLQGREVRRTIEEIQKAGSPVRYYAVDVSESRAVRSEGPAWTWMAGSLVRAVLSEVRKEWGPVTGLIHGAGVLSDKLLKDKTERQFDLVFDTKVRGLTELLSALEGDPLKMIALFSSVAARFGNAGQSDYAMANEVLNKVGQAERRKRGNACLVKSFNWGPWDGGMVQPALREEMTRRGVTLIPVAAGDDLFIREITNAPSDAVEVLVGGPGYAAAAAPETNVPETGSTLRRVDSRRFAALGDHRVKDAAVFPVVMAVEWFGELAGDLFPSHRLADVRNLKVLKGMTLARFEAEGDLFQVSYRLTENGADRKKLLMEIATPGGPVHFASEVELASRLGLAAPAPQGDTWNGSAVTRRSFYDLYFHGPAFQVLEQMNGTTADALRAALSATPGLGVRSSGWKTDAAFLEGGLQTAGYWMRLKSRAAALPTSVREILFYEPAAGELRATSITRLREADNARCVVDVVFTDAQGRTVAEMRGVEVHALSWDYARNPSASPELQPPQTHVR